MLNIQPATTTLLTTFDLVFCLQGKLVQTRMDIHKMFGPIFEGVTPDMPQHLARIDSKVHCPYIHCRPKILGYTWPGHCTHSHRLHVSQCKASRPPLLLRSQHHAHMQPYHDKVDGKAKWAKIEMWPIVVTTAQNDSSNISSHRICCRRQTANLCMQWQGL